MVPNLITGKKMLTWGNPSVTGYGFRQREKGSYLNLGILGEFVEEGFKD
jgi:hypothetical protein